MAQSRLNIIKDSSKEDSTSRPFFASRLDRKKALQAKFERLWLLHPEQFNPLRNCMERERLERTWSLLTHYIHPHEKFMADIGCGAGVFSRRLRDAGAKVDAIDIAENALKYMREQDTHDITPKQDAMPSTMLPDQAYDAIVCTELIAELPPEDYRLFFSELSRLIKPNRYVICSSPLDIRTEGGVKKLMELAETEFTIDGFVLSYHALYIRLKNFFKAPGRYVKGWKDPHFRQQEQERRAGFSRFWFRLHSTPPLVWLWIPISWLFIPILATFRNSHYLLIGLEKICQFLWDESGISHIIFIGKRRPFSPEAPQPTPIERPKKKQIWE